MDRLTRETWLSMDILSIARAPQRAGTVWLPKNAVKGMGLAHERVAIAEDPDFCLVRRK